MGKHISALGTCIIRDIFGFHNNNGGYIVDRFIQCNSPISIMGQMPIKSSYVHDDISKYWDDQKNSIKIC